MQQSLFAKEKLKLEYPHYKIDVSYDHDKTLLVGKMQVRFSKKGFPDRELLFSLPGNRFFSRDSRGNRKHKIIPVFSVRRFRENNEDPTSPKGFSYGEMKIHSVSSYNNELTNKRITLDYKLENNLEIEIGYSTENGLLRIFIPEGLSDSKSFHDERIIEIKFSTKFPEHLFDGLSNGMLIATNWFPKLLTWRKGKVSEVSERQIKDAEANEQL